MTDPDLLNAHLRSDPVAFTTLVARYLNLVHAAATRQCPAHADDITQAVFLLLSQKAPTLRNRPSLAGWLFQTTQLCAKNARRADRRRQLHEREAAMHPPQNPTPTDPPEPIHLLPLLDDAIASLPAADRELLILRHLQNQNLSDIAAHFHLTVPAATKRIQRAVNKLRAWFLSHHHPVSDSSLSALFLTAAAHHAPATLHITTTATAASATTLTLTKGALLTMTTAKLQTAAIITAACLLITIPAAVLVVHHNAPAAPVASATPDSAPAAEVATPEPTLDDPTVAYALKPGQLIAHFPNPPAEAHDLYEQKHHPGTPLGERGHLIFAYSDDGSLTEMGYMMGSQYTVRSLLQTTVGIHPQDIDSSASFGPALWPITGDVVYRQGATPDQYIAALQQFVQQELHIKATLALRNVDHPVIVLRGTWTHDKTLDENPRKPAIRLMQGDAPVDGVYPKYTSSDSVGSNLATFAATVGYWINEPVVAECKGFPKNVELKYYEAPLTDFAAHFSPKSKERLLGQVTQQTGFTWTEEVRNVQRLSVNVGK
jgi:RNA polymerase sigma factor (sigma-70 family)